MNKFGYSIFGELNGEYVPFYFSDNFPTGGTRGSALVYLRKEYIENKLNKIVSNKINSVENPQYALDDFKWMISFYKVLKVEISNEEYNELQNFDLENKKPECYRFIWVGGWEFPNSNKRKVFI